MIKTQYNTNSSSVRSCVGIEIFDTEIVYIQLEPQTIQDQQCLVPVSHGKVGIAYDAVEGGHIVNTTSVLQSLKKLRAITSCDCVTFALHGTADMEDSWKELINVAGFSDVVKVSVNDALSAYFPQDHVIPVFFVSPEQMLIGSGRARNFQYNYPLDVNGILDLQDATSKPEDGSLLVMGRFDFDMQEITELFEDYGLPARPADVWQRCFSHELHIPEISLQESHQYAASVALAYCGAYRVVLETKALRQEEVVVPEDNSLQSKMKESLVGESEKLQKDDTTADVVPKENKQVRDITTSELAPKNTKQNMGLQKMFFKKPVVLERGAAQSPKVKEVNGTKENPTTSEVQNTLQKPRSVWLSDVDEMIYQMFGKTSTSEK